MTDLFRKTSSTFERLASRRLLTHKIQHNGVTRDALVYRPQHSRRRMLPLVLVFHGGASSPESIARRSEMHKLAETEEFLVAYPRGTAGVSGLTWHPAGSKSSRKRDDVGFVRALIADLREHYAIDASRIFVTGFSIGGSLAYELACGMAEEIAAVAIVSGAMMTERCAPARAVPLLHIHGTRDKRVPVEGGRGAATRRAGDWPPVREAIERWRTINGCTGAPLVRRLGHQGVTGYLSAGAADVELWLVEGSGHVWPGGWRVMAPTKDGEHPAPQVDHAGFAATPMIWTFFAAHPRPRNPGPERRPAP